LLDACQQSPGMGAHQYVSTMITFNLSHAIGSTCIHNNVQSIELDSHADMLVGCHALIIHEYPKVVMVSSFDPSQLPWKVNCCCCCLVDLP
jgi:hypothetical protein